MAQSKTATKTTTSKRKTSSRSMKKAAVRTGADAGDEAVTIDRRRNKERRDADVESAEKLSPAAPTLERRKKVSRRRQIDPTTCERDYTDQEVEFMNALDDYKRKSGRMFPTCSEVLEVINSLGYVKLTAAELNAGTHAPAASAKPMAPPIWGGDESVATFGAVEENA